LYYSQSSKRHRGGRTQRHTGTANRIKLPICRSNRIEGTGVGELAVSIPTDAKCRPNVDRDVDVDEEDTVGVAERRIQRASYDCRVN